MGFRVEGSFSGSFECVGGRGFRVEGSVFRV